MKLSYKKTLLVGLFFIYGVLLSVEKFEKIDKIAKYESKIEEAKKTLKEPDDEKYPGVMTSRWLRAKRDVVYYTQKRDALKQNVLRQDALGQDVLRRDALIAKMVGAAKL